LACGTLEIKKAQHIVLTALRQVERAAGLKNDFRVTIVGDGPMRAHLQKMVRDFGWQDRVRFTGYLPYAGPQLVREYRDADIFVLPSMTIKGDKEGIPGTIVEAMASGLPVVSTYHAGIPSVVKDQEDGLLVKEGDINGLAAALRELIDDPGMRERLGRNGAARAAVKLNARNRIADLEKIYGALTGRRSKRKGTHAE
jgi:colanic acid/amylovoran biosynthesis glycosyltransferase